MKKRFLLFCICAIVAYVFVTAPRRYDVCVYGGTSAAVTAAYSAAQMGKKVVVVSPDMHIGGLTTGGLGYTDIGNKQVVFGVAKQFYRKLGERYGRLESWIFEPSAALEVMESYLNHPNITVHKGVRLSRVSKSGARIKSLTATGSKGKFVKVTAPYFIDATYEGDLMAQSGVSYFVGREANSVYGETWNGVQFLEEAHQFPDGVDPYREKGNPQSGLLWGISDDKLAENGAADRLMQAYNYRICLTDSVENRLPIERPENYDSTRYELLLRLMAAQPDKRTLNDYFIWSHMPGRKTDVNNRGGFSTDMIGANHDYPHADYEKRDAIIKAHKDYTLGLLYFVGHDERVPSALREQMLQWGLPKDEYVEDGHWTPQLYVRECRRMIGEYVATQRDCEQLTTVEDWVGMAAYTMDSHNCQRIVVEKDGVAMVKNEGNVERSVGGPFPISYRSITPKREECTNLLVPVALSASHIAYGSIRMEPVFMVLGQACGIAASLASGSAGAACTGAGAIQDIDAAHIRAIMQTNPYMDGTQPDIIIEDGDARITYSDGWVQTKSKRAYGPTYYHLAKTTADAFVLYDLPDTLSGQWDIYCYQILRGEANPKAYYQVTTASGQSDVVFDKAKLPRVGQVSGEWFYLGTYDLSGGGKVKMTSDTSHLPLRSDALMLVKKK